MDNLAELKKLIDKLAAHPKPDELLYGIAADMYSVWLKMKEANHE